MQLMYYICAISMNNLMLRQELCMWKTGMKIRYNVSCLEGWVHRKKMVSLHNFNMQIVRNKHAKCYISYTVQCMQKKYLLYIT